MTKLQVYIDFEAISAPFSNNLKINNDLPYAYSIGIHKGKKFKTKTTIINFNNVSKDDVFEFIRIDISDKLRILTGDKTFKTNSDSIIFVGWAPLLEKKILSKSFKGIKVIDQTKGDSISLSSLTEEEFKDANYFESLKDEVKKKLDPEFITRRGLDHDGALAALAGYELYRSALNIKGKWDISINIRTLVKEIAEYSKDDILRMSFLFKNQSLFEKRKKDLIEKNAIKQKLSRKINKLNSLIKILDEYNPNDSIEKVINSSTKELKKLKKDKDNL